MLQTLTIVFFMCWRYTNKSWDQPLSQGVVASAVLWQFSEIFGRTLRIFWVWGQSPQALKSLALCSFPQTQFPERKEECFTKTVNSIGMFVFMFPDKDKLTLPDLPPRSSPGSGVPGEKVSLWPPPAFHLQDKGLRRWEWPGRVPEKSSLSGPLRHAEGASERAGTGLCCPHNTLQQAAA